MQVLPRRPWQAARRRARRPRLRGRARHRLRPARPERRRQVDDREDPLHADPRRRAARRSSPASTSPPTRSPYAGGSAWSRRRPSSDPIATGRENLVLAARIQGLSKAEAGERSDRLLDRFGLADAADRLVRTWSGGMSRKLDVAIGLVHRPRGPLPGRADDRTRPRGPGRAVGGDRSARRRRRDDGPADDALPRRGGPAGPPAGDRRPRSGRGRGDARGAQARAARRHRRGRGRHARGRDRRHRRAGASVGSLRGRARTGPRCGPAPTWVRAPYRRCSPPSTDAGSRSCQRHGRPALAGRRVPAPRRSQLRAGRWCRRRWRDDRRTRPLGVPHAPLGDRRWCGSRSSSSSP